MMQYAIHSLLALAALGLSIPAARAHYNMFLPEKHSVKRGEAVTLLHQWGHPFEHQLFDAPAAEKVFVLSPDGTTIDLTKRLEKVIALTADAKQVAAYRLHFTADQRGDYVFVLSSAPIWMPEDQVFFQDTVKVVLHVQAQKGWDAVAEVPLQLTPLTRPYGLQPGMVFQAEVDQRPLPRNPVDSANLLVEIEHYNASPPKTSLPDEQITRTVKTDRNGVATCTLTEPGWWCVTALRDGDKREHEGRTYPVRKRATFWVYVDDKITANPSK
jgi:cobalt/nickel transport protein